MIGFIGLSHLGLNYSLATAAKSFDVVAYDPDSALVARCAAGEFPIEEPGFGELFAQHRARIRYTSDKTALAECDLVFYSLDVRTNERNESDLGPLTALIRATEPHLSAGTTAVVLSQVSPGYTRHLRTELRERSPADLYYQVETLIFGRAVERALRPERFIVGADAPARSLPAPFQAWHAAFECPVLVMRLESAELTKIAINFFLVSTVATTNTLAEICEAIGADWNEIAPALRLDRRIGPHAYLSPGLGIAGGNLERDLVTVQFLAAKHATEAGIVSAWQRNSAHRRGWAIRQVRRALSGDEKDAALAVWGLAYKADTHSTKNSPALELMRTFPGCRIRAHDPVAQIDVSGLPHVTIVASPLAAAEGADLLVVMTPWSSYASLPLRELQNLLRGRVIIDPFAILDEGECRSLGFEYHRLGN
ncbi:MAG: UDPglucose 6-dehydrogenase [Verrucomicrobiota bacterium]|jgi:UDPglucose 6-dehydrogenase